MMKKIAQCFLLIILLIGSGKPIFADDTKWEDENTPISFRVELLAWEEVDEIIPNKSKFTIIDVETGLMFRVQRRAGSRHADVQPLSSEETAIMKKIYNGKWSWNRKAIIVLAGDKMIAASMAGMPHGAGVLKNDFRGHFCVHFYGSTTHRSNRVDPAHQLMVLKASGKLHDYLQEASVEEVFQAFEIAINQQDETLFNLVSDGRSCKKCFQDIVNKVSYLSISSIEKNERENNLFFNTVTAKVEFFNENNKKINKFANFLLKRSNPYEQWVIDFNQFKSIID